jgi:hypothetical protein
MRRHASIATKNSRAQLRAVYVFIAEAQEK